MNGEHPFGVYDWDIAPPGKNWNDTRGWPDGDNILKIVKRNARPMGPCEPWTQKVIYVCAICGGPGGTKHHLIPRSTIHKVGKSWQVTMRLCRKCHDEVHYYISHWELATYFNTEELLKAELHKRKSTHEHQ